MSNKQEAATEQDLGKKVFVIDSPIKRHEVQRALESVKVHATRLARSEPRRAMMYRASAAAFTTLLSEANGIASSYAVVQVNASSACRRQLTREELGQVMAFVAKVVPPHRSNYGQPRPRRQSSAA